MNTNFHSDGNIRSGTVGGTLLVFLLELSTGEVFKTAVLAAIGATVSFAVSLGLKWLLRKLKKHLK